MIRLAALLASASALACAETFELRGSVTGDYSGALRVHAFGIEIPFAASAPLSPQGEFRFRGLAPGFYTIAVVRTGLGEVRRTVAIDTASADRRGIVRTEIRYSPSEAAWNGSAGVVNVRALSVSDDARSKYAAAESALARRDTGAAVRLFEEAAAKSPQFAAAWNALGVIAFQQHDAAAAERYFRRAIEAEPGAFDATVNLGGLLLRSGRAEEALRYNQNAAADRPHDATANAQLGMNHFRLGHFNDAEPYLLAARDTDPAHHTQPQLFLAEIYRRRGEPEAAIRELNDLLARHPDAANREAVLKAIGELGYLVK